MKFDIVTMDLLHAMLLNPNLYGPSDEAEEAAQASGKRFYKTSFCSRNISLPVPLHTAILGFGTDSRRNYHAVFLLRAVSPKVFDNVSARISYRTETKNPLLWVPANLDGCGYLNYVGEGEQGKSGKPVPYICVVPSSSGPHGQADMRSIFLGESGAEPRKLGEFEDFTSEVGSLLGFAQSYISACYRGKRKMPGFKNLEDMTLYFDCL